MRTLVILLCFSFVPCVIAQRKEQKALTQTEVGEWLNKQQDCPEEHHDVVFERFDRVDFKRDGTQQVIVNGYSCMSGSSGRDVQTVVSRDSQGKFVEMKIDEVDPKTYDNMFGNRNCDLTEQNGLLVATWSDDPYRPPPLVIKYKWNGKEFVVVSIKKTGIFRTSYDCTAKLNETENAICHTEPRANLDLSLNSVYRSLLARLPDNEREALRKDQRAWIASRDRFGPSKLWVQGTSHYYQERIDELKKRLDLSNMRR